MSRVAVLAMIGVVGFLAAQTMGSGSRYQLPNGYVSERVGNGYLTHKEQADASN